MEIKNDVRLCRPESPGSRRDPDDPESGLRGLEKGQRKGHDRVLTHDPITPVGDPGGDPVSAGWPEDSFVSPSVRPSIRLYVSFLGRSDGRWVGCSVSSFLVRMCVCLSSSFSFAKFPN